MEPYSLVPEHDSLTVTTNGLVLLALSEKTQVIGKLSAATGLGTAATSSEPPMITASAIVLFDIRHTLRAPAERRILWQRHRLSVVWH